MHENKIHDHIIAIKFDLINNVAVDEHLGSCAYRLLQSDINMYNHSCTQRMRSWRQILEEIVLEISDVP